MIDAWLVFSGVIAAAAGVGANGLRVRDLVRHGLLHRRREELTRRGENMPTSLKVSDQACGVNAFWTGSRR